MHPFKPGAAGRGRLFGNDLSKVAFKVLIVGNRFQRVARCRIGLRQQITPGRRTAALLAAAFLTAAGQTVDDSASSASSGGGALPMRRSTSMVSSGSLGPFSHLGR